MFSSGSIEKMAAQKPKRLKFNEKFYDSKNILFKIDKVHLTITIFLTNFPILVVNNLCLCGFSLPGALRLL